jgi:hypothetical protein
MRVETAHALGRAVARQRLDRIVDDLTTRAWPGVDVSDITHRWSGDRLEFGFTAAKGFFSVAMRGHLDVYDTRAVLDVEVPPMVTTFLGEDRVRTALQTELERVLGVELREEDRRQ